MEDNVEVYFCDLCNTSVPEVDLGAGEAVRHSGKIIGSCCRKTIRKVDRPPASVAAGSGRSLAALGIALLAAVAAVAVFLDWRFATETNNLREDVAASQRAALGDVVDRLGVIEEQQGAQSGLGSAVGEARVDVAALGKQVGQRFGGIEAAGDPRAFVGSRHREHDGRRAFDRDPEEPCSTEEPVPLRVHCDTETLDLDVVRTASGPVPPGRPGQPSARVPQIRDAPGH